MYLSLRSPVFFFYRFSFWEFNYLFNLDFFYLRGNKEWRIFFCIFQLNIDSFFYLPILFQLSGIAFLLIGLGSLFMRHGYISLLNNQLFPITTYIFIGTGGLILLMGCVGCIGTVREVRCCLIFVSTYSKSSIHLIFIYQHCFLTSLVL